MLADKHVLKILKISHSLLMLEDNLKGKINMFDLEQWKMAHASWQ